VTVRSDVLTTRSSAAWLRRAVRRTALGRHLQSAVIVVVLVATTLTGLVRVEWEPMAAPIGIFYLISVLAGLFLSPKRVLFAYAYILGWSLYSTMRETEDLRDLWGIAILALLMLVMYWVASSRARLGVQGLSGENLLVDLRDRLQTHGKIPPLPPGWYAESELQSAYGEGFSGDFIVTSLSNDERCFEIVVVDVSGKGAGAGSRSLVLSGAFGGLLGSMPPEEFLGAANAYLLRQDWREGFATAVHLVVDTLTGEFSLGSAGHPPAVRFSAGSGRWEPLDGVAGPLLGVIPRAEFPRSRGVLGRGDAVLLYTDGVIETRNRDLHDGIDRMLGLAERLIGKGFPGMAEKMCAAARAGETDDRVVAIVWRS
jgi:hypothetical protein